jgi:UDP-N-acetylglucosamine--N-acetylmuramyl-(pentapeptide) pyrophosphoryl-undecaprenol N-acetylglucosamine transferase
VPEAGFPLELIQVGQLKNVSLATRARTLADLPLGLMRCVELVRSFKPDVVVGVGGYASGPAMMAAILLRVPTLAFEPNAVPGLANRLVGKWVNAAAVNFEETRRYFRGARLTGIPVRREFFSIGDLPQKEEPSRALRLLVFGGSQGARIFNEVMPKIAKSLMEYVPGLRILHQAGAKFAEPVEAAYGASGADATRWEVSAFLDDMPRRFAEADLILCRSGASTVAELAAAGKAAVLVPLPTAADNHQLKNAEVFAAAGAAVLRVQSSDAAMESFLFSDLSALLLAPARRREMSRKVRGLAHSDAVSVIGDMVVGLGRAGE